MKAKLLILGVSVVSLMLLPVLVLGASAVLQLDKKIIPQGTALTGALEIKAEVYEELVLEYGVSCLRGGVSWEILQPNKSIVHISSTTAQLSINAFTVPVEVEAGASIFVPICLFWWDGDFIFRQPGEYEVKLLVNTTLNNEDLVLENSSNVEVVEYVDGFSQWDQVFQTLGAVVEPFWFGCEYSYFSDIVFDEEGVYRKSLDELFVYNLGEFSVHHYFASGGKGEIEGIEGGKFKSTVESGVALAKKTGIGEGLWNYISHEFNENYSQYGELEVDKSNLARWRIQ